MKEHSSYVTKEWVWRQMARRYVFLHFTHVERQVGMKTMDTVNVTSQRSFPGKVRLLKCVKWKGGSWCRRAWMPADPLFAGLFAGLLNRAQAQRGILGNCLLGFDKSPSATLWKASGPSTSLMLDHNTKHMMESANGLQVPLRVQWWQEVANENLQSANQKKMTVVDKGNMACELASNCETQFHANLAVHVE